MTNLSETSYAGRGGELWRIGSDALFSGAATSALSIRREQLTGLSNALRSKVVEETLGGSTREHRTWFAAA